MAARDVGGIPEMIIHGKTDLLSAVEYSKALGQNLKTLIANPELARSLETTGKHRAEELFSIWSMVDGNLWIYRELFRSPQLAATR